MVSILAMHGANRFDEIEEIHIRVGGLPQNPKPPLDYQLVFSVEGLINEYIEVARVIRDGEIKEVESMTELESLVVRRFSRARSLSDFGRNIDLARYFSRQNPRARLQNDPLRRALREIQNDDRSRALFERRDRRRFCKGQTAQGFRRASAKTSSGRRARLCSRSARICRRKSGGETKRLRYDIVDKHDEETGSERDDADDGFSGFDHRADDGEAATF